MPGPEPAADAGALFDKPPAEVRRFLEAKGLQPSWHWQDFSFDEHAVSFTVAKSAGYDILADLKGSLDKALAERMDFEQWRATIEPTLKAKGWWGRAQSIDPLTGEAKVVMLGSPGRLQTIWWANTTGAYAAGEWERIQRTKRVLPYLEYLHTISEHPRPEHLAWVGTIKPVDDPWWRTHYPPNGWQCKCRVRQLADAEMERKGGLTEEPADFGTKDFVNKRTGEVSRVPKGIDPGWAQNPGAGRTQNAADMLAGRLDAMSDDARQAAAADLADSWLVKRIASGTIPFDPTSADPDMVSRGRIAAPFAVAPGRVAETLGVESRVVRVRVKEASTAKLPDGFGSIAQDLLEFGKVAKREPGEGATARIALTGGGFEAWLIAPEDSPGAIVLERLWRADPGSGGGSR